MSNVERMCPDYVRSYTDSKILASRIQSFWHNKGYSLVRVWVEEEIGLTNDVKSYSVRSNIAFNCNTIMKDLFNNGKV